MTLKAQRETGNAPEQVLERMIDHSTLADVLETLANICADKADHIRSNWQDEGTASYWTAASRKLDTLASKVGI